MPMPRKEKEKGAFDGRDADYRAINLREMGRPAERASERASERGRWLSAYGALRSRLSPPSCPVPGGSRAAYAAGGAASSSRGLMVT